MLTKLSWVRENAGKISPSLRGKILDTYRHHRWVPCFLHTLAEKFKHRFLRHKVIIRLNEEHSAVLADAGQKTVLGCRVEHRLPLINGFSTKISVNHLRGIVTHPAIVRVWEDRPVYALLDVASPVVHAPQVWETGNRGQGVTIAVIDTGIYPHPDLTTPENRIIGFKDFVKKKTNPYDDNGHGTHCAGDAAGNGSKSGGKYRGPAPLANLVGVKVLNKMGAGSTSTIIAGVQWCIGQKNQYGIRILSLSLGGAAAQPSDDDPLCLAVRGAWDAGLVVCVAAGNEGPGAQTIGTPGIEPAIITVGALDDKNSQEAADYSIASFSSRGPTVEGLAKPDLVTPGVNIISLRVPKSYLDKKNPQTRIDDWYASLSGTSMATPICAGVAALVIEKYPHLEPAQVKTLLMENCRFVDPDVYAQGAGLVDAYASAAGPQ